MNDQVTTEGLLRDVLQEMRETLAGAQERRSACVIWRRRRWTTSRHWRARPMKASGDRKTVGRTRARVLPNSNTLAGLGDPLNPLVAAKNGTLNA